MDRLKLNYLSDWLEYIESHQLPSALRVECGEYTFEDGDEAQDREYFILYTSWGDGELLSMVEAAADSQAIGVVCAVLLAEQQDFRSANREPRYGDLSQAHLTWARPAFRDNTFIRGVVESMRLELLGDMGRPWEQIKKEMGL